MENTKNVNNDKKSNGGSEDKGAVDSTDGENTIYFYTDVYRDKVAELNKNLEKTARTLIEISSRFGMGEPPPIVLRINSYGGIIFAGFSAMDFILKSRVRVHTIVDGIAASAATLISVAGHKRFISKHGCMMIHQLSGECWGTFERFKDSMKNKELQTKMIKNFYLEYTKMKATQLDELMKRDLYLNAKQCLKYGLVDEII